MPIKPENKKRYPADWLDISASIRKRAEKDGVICCEECGIPNYSIGVRWIGVWYQAPEGTKHGDMMRVLGVERKTIRIVLTVAHLNHKPEDCDPANLKCWCQRCHLAYDKEYHIESARRTRAEKTGQMHLFPNPLEGQ